MKLSNIIIVIIILASIFFDLLIYGSFLSQFIQLINLQ